MGEIIKFPTPAELALAAALEAKHNLMASGVIDLFMEQVREINEVYGVKNDN